ncbi:MAG: metal ABC transporter permease [Rickettsiales bacterium]
MLHAVMAACGVAMLAGMSGSFIVWRRMAYMGDAMSHAAILGVVLGLVLGIATPIAVLIVALLAGIALSRMQRDRRLPGDALLALIASGGFACGLVLFHSLPNRQVDLFGYLFGDVLAVSRMELWVIYAMLALQGLFISLSWRPLMRMTVHTEIAQVEGVPVAKLQMLMTAMVAITVAMALQVVGMLLITALLVIPPLTARLFARTPEQMVFGAMGVGVVAASGGMWVSAHYDLPTGPTIVVVALGLFIFSWLTNALLFKPQH